MGTNRNDGYHGGKPMPRYIIPEPAPNQIFDTPETKTITEAKREVEVFTESDVVVVGGGLVGCELALDLAMKGKKVTIVEALDKLMAVNGPLCSANKEMLEKLIPYNGIDVVTSAKVTEYKNGVLKANVGDETKEISADSVVLCVGYSSENTLYNAHKNDVDEIYLLGDARQVSNIMYAIWDAFEVANHID